MEPGASAADIQQALTDDEVYLKLLPLGGKTYGVLLTRKAVKPYAVDMGRGQVQAAVTRLRQPLEPTESLIPFDAAGSAALFDRLFGPVKATRARGRWWSADGARPLPATSRQVVASR